MSELARVAAADRVAPTAVNARRIADLGAEAVRHRVSLWFGRLTMAAVSVARAIAVLGSDATLRYVGALAGLSLDSVAEAVDVLREADLVVTSSASSSPVDPLRLEFVHPLLREAIYEDMGTVARINGHRTAAALLLAAGARTEHAASHLMRTPPQHSSHHAFVLRRAADEAMRRGAESGSHSHNEIVLEVPEESSLPDPNVASDAQEAVTLSAGPIGCCSNR
ncbi:hypothetical protein [Streptomyces sp. PKU-EA00015]|uniref:hypothetical protein n=1 Tax=Streptomyces sp. PKU-EA00015 TaxID=2748326 RepID=UPI00210A2521|nr:hypothetical protein [Streptomyces sp. PKU-EA00015]